MGIFKEQSLRLLREDWPNSKLLADELYAILNSDEPMVIDGPVTINNSSDQPAITTTNFGNSDVSIRIGKKPDASIPPFPGLPPLDPGSISITDIFPDGSVQPSSGSTSPAPSTGGGGLPAQVISGTGATYRVKVYPNGTSAAGTLVIATQLQIDPDETIPAGTWTIATKIGSKYYIQVPVWLEDLP